jgi:hypothetical protein
MLKETIYDMCGRMARQLDTKEGWTYYYLECSDKKTRKQLTSVLDDLTVMYLKKYKRGGY